MNNIENSDKQKTDKNLNELKSLMDKAEVDQSSNVDELMYADQHVKMNKKVPTGQTIKTDHELEDEDSKSSSAEGEQEVKKELSPPTPPVISDKQIADEITTQFPEDLHLPTWIDDKFHEAYKSRYEYDEKKNTVKIP